MSSKLAYILLLMILNSQCFSKDGTPGDALRRARNILEKCEVSAKKTTEPKQLKIIYSYVSGLKMAIELYRVHFVFDVLEAHSAKYEDRVSPYCKAMLDTAESALLKSRQYRAQDRFDSYLVAAELNCSTAETIAKMGPIPKPVERNPNVPPPPVFYPINPAMGKKVFAAPTKIQPKSSP